LRPLKDTLNSADRTRPAQNAGWSTEQRGWLLLAIILGVAAVFRLYHLDTYGLWRDETQTVFLARHSFPSGILQALTVADVSPPLYYFLLHFWDRAFGSDWSLRFFSVIFGLALIPLVYWVGRRIFDSRVALLAAWVAALSPHHIIVSRQVRMYTLLPLAALAALYFTHRFVTQPADAPRRGGTDASRLTASGAMGGAASRRLSPQKARDGVPRGGRVWWGVVLSFALVLYTHNVGALLILSLNAFFLTEIIWRKEARHLFWPWVKAQICVVLLYAPMAPLLLQQLRLQGAVMGPWLPRYSRLGNALRLLNELTGLAWPNGWPLLWMAVCALGIFAIKLRRAFAAVYLRFSPDLDLLLFGFFGPIVLAALLTPRTIGSIPSYVTLVAFPAMCYLLARGVSALRPRMLPRRGGTEYLSLALLLGLSIVWVHTVTTSWTFAIRHSNLREIAAYVSQHIGSEDMIVVAPDYLASTFNYYYPGPQKQAAFPAALDRVEDITWLGWAEKWKNADQFVEPTVQYVAEELPAGARLWFIAPLGAYPDDPYFSQMRVLKSRFDQVYGVPQVVTSFPAAVETAEIYIYD
jgi:4-amino-4-deoxy-L-arabinose transferase-like glycosyltransferase